MGRPRRRRIGQVLARDADRAAHRDLKRGVFFLVCDGLKSPPDSVNTVFPAAIVQTSSVHLVPQHLPQVLGPDRPGHETDLHRPTVTVVRDRYEEFAEKQGHPLPGDHDAVGQHLGRSSSRSWTTTPEIRKVICSTNATRVPQHPLPARSPGPRALPERADSDEEALPSHPAPEPQQQPAEPDGACAAEPTLNTTFTDRIPAAEDHRP